MLPEPTLTFTIPSLHDGVTLNCRVYHPWSLSPSTKAPPWHRHAAVVAHPYAPMGGSYDDAIVTLVAETLLRAGFLVTTFNFRGAAHSEGRTSWTGKPERADYMSVAGFVCHYAHFLDPFRRTPFSSRPVSPIRDEATLEPSTPSPVTSAPPLTPPARAHAHHTTLSSPPLLLFAGYSYGALITSQLPSVPTILAPFANPESGTPAAEIRLRAEHLAETQNMVLGAARRATERERRGTGGESPRKSLTLRVGGDEDIASRRKSHDAHRSPLRASFDDAEEKLRRGVADLLAKTKHHSPHNRHKYPGSGGNLIVDEPRRRVVSSPVTGRPSIDGKPHGAPQSPSKNTQAGPEVQEKRLPTLPQPPSPRPAYLLVSPPLSFAGNLTAISFSLPGFAKRSASTRRGVPHQSTAGEESPPAGAALSATEESNLDEAEHKLVESPTLVIYGGHDVFVSNRRMRQWATRLQGIPGSRLRAHEVTPAGHFWQERSESGGNVIDVLLHAVKTHATTLLKS